VAANTSASLPLVARPTGEQTAQRIGLKVAAVLVFVLSQLAQSVNQTLGYPPDIGEIIFFLPQCHLKMMRS
jgi:hypothetical protein